MSDRFVEAFVEKLLLLEQRVGANVQYRVMPPFTAPFVDQISIQQTVKDIAQFIGLTGFTFIVAVARQKEKVGGHIDLSASGPEVFIEIDSDMMKFPDAVAATLCHEVCHKWLQTNGIRLPITTENEILTDITTVFLGFGKIMLNGCNATHVRHESVPNGTRTITKTLKSGYLDRDQFAFVYRLVCSMRNVPESDSIQGLSSEAMQAVQSCNATLGHHYDARFHRAETLQDSVAHLDSIITDHQRNLANLKKHTVYARQSFLETIDAFVVASHTNLSSLRQKAAAMTQGGELDPVVRFLQSIQKQRELNRMAETLSPMTDAMHGFLKHTRSICRYFYRHADRFPVPTPETFSIVTCPQDGTKLRLPENSGDLIATCPTCEYRFAYNTAVPEFSEPVKTPRRKTWLSRLFGK